MKKKAQNQKGMTRREFIVTTGAATGAALVTASVGPFVHTTMAKGGTLKICSYGGSYQESQSKALIQPFADKFGVKIIEASGPDIAKVKSIPMSLTSTESTSKPSAKLPSEIFSGPLH
jgi:putative spermidine/putrescine transport system substrate-binding protein